MNVVKEVSANYMHVEGTIIPDSVTTTNSNGGEITVLEEPAITPEELKAQVEEMLNKPGVRDNAVTNATYINQRFRGKWFTVQQLMKKTSMKKYEPAYDILNLLCFLGLAYREEKGKGVIKYKITISKEDKLKLLEGELAEAQLKVSDLQGQIKDLLLN